MKHTAEEYAEFAEQLDNLIRDSRQLLNDDMRLGKPLTEALQAARMRFEDVRERD